MSNHVFVISHRRSGTHLTIDAISNNFPIYRAGYLNVDQLTERHQKQVRASDIQAKLNHSPYIVKTHTHGDIRTFFDNKQNLYSFLEDTLSSAKAIYVYRDGRDVLTSLYHYSKKFELVDQECTFADFIRMNNDFDQETYHGEMNRPEYWAYHINSWFGQDHIFYLPFENMINHYEQTISNLANFLELPQSRDLIDVRRKTSKYQHFMLYKIYHLLRKKFLDKYFNLGVRYTSVQFRKGQSKDYVNFFSEEDLRYFDATTSGIMNKI